MTPDFLAGLLIGSFLVYACWLFSLRPEPEDPLRNYDFCAIPACPECRPDEPHFADCPEQDRVLAALLVLGEELPDDR